MWHSVYWRSSSPCLYPGGGADNGLLVRRYHPGIALGASGLSNRQGIHQSEKHKPSLGLPKQNQQVGKPHSSGSDNDCQQHIAQSRPGVARSLRSHRFTAADRRRGPRREVRVLGHNSMRLSTRRCTPTESTNSTPLLSSADTIAVRVAPRNSMRGGWLLLICRFVARARTATSRATDAPHGSEGR